MSLLSLFFIGSSLLIQQDTVAVRYSKEVKASDLESYLRVLASREFEGRETGKKGQKLAAAYIAKTFQLNGVSGPVNDTGYFQKYPITFQNPEGIEIKSGKKKFHFLKDFYFFPGFQDVVIDADSILFAGYGIDAAAYSDYKKSNVQGKVVFALEGEPYKDGLTVIGQTKEPGEWTNSWRLKTDAAIRNKAKAVFIITENFEKRLNASRHSIENPNARLDIPGKAKKESIPYIYISPKMAEKILGKKIADLKKPGVDGFPQHFTQKKNLKLKVNRPVTKIEAENVLGFIPGSKHRDEVIVISAHYDHLGKKDTTIYYGADDDGSGTSALLAISKAFAKAYKDGNGPKRSILFLAVSGEEKGLLGSEYYTTNPVFPLKNTVADLNVDMIGRRDKKYADDPDYIYVIGSDKISTELHRVNEEANSTYSGLKLDYTYNTLTDPNRYYFRSDHYNFAKNNVPVVFYFNGVHEDYHKPTDTIDKIEFGKMEKISRHIFFTAWELANRPKRITNDRKAAKE